MRSVVRTATAVIVLGLLGWGVPALADPPGRQACDAYASSPEVSALPADFVDSGCGWIGRVVRDGGVGVTIPPAGQEVRLDAVGVGGSRTLRLVHSRSGRITIYRDAGTRAAAGSSQPASAPIATCSDAAFSVEGFRVAGGYSFSYNPYAAPDEVASGTPSALANAFSNAAAAATDCRAATRHPGPAPHYLGTVAGRFANISSSYNCGVPDAYNTISWLSGGPHVLAVTCLWSSAGVLRFSDAVMNRSLAFFTGRIPAGCSSTTDLQGVMTHEAGHTYGLGHADEGSKDNGLHGNQTMNSVLAPCTTKYRTLGTGDLNGMTSLY